MQQFDTLKISVPAEAVSRVNTAAFLSKPTVDMGTGETQEMMKAKSSALPVGVSGIAYKEGGGYQLTFSAKVLCDDYLQGISLNNWHRGLEAVEGIIKADAYQVYDTAVVYRCDTTNNLSIDDIGYKPSLVYPALLAAKTNQRFKEIYYSSKKKMGIEFRGVQQEKNRMIIYDKKLDLLKRTNREFMESLIRPVDMLESAERIIRCEVNHTSFRSMRKRFDVKEHSLKNVLNSLVPVNHNFLKKIFQTDDVKQTALFEEFEDFGGPGIDFVMMKGAKSIIEELGYSQEKVKAFFRYIMPDENKFKYHWYKKKNNVRDIMEMMQQKKYGVSSFDVSTICNNVLKCLIQSVAA